MVMTAHARQDMNALKLTTAGVLNAIRAKDIYAVYQPQFEAATGRLSGLEVLARWNVGAKRHIPPSQFIPYIESSTFECELIFSLVEEVGVLLRRHPAYSGTVSINASLHALAGHDFFPSLERVLHANNVPMRRVLVEITENTTVNDAEALRIQAHICRLREAGLTFSLDDFGTGFAGMQALDLFECRQVKIAKPFLHRARTSQRSRRILASMVDVIHAAGASVVMEGLESDEDLDLSRAVGADQLQGYLLGAPQSADAVAGAYFGDARCQHVAGRLPLM